MPGRKQPEETESERKREYRLAQKRGYGEEVVGDEAKDIADTGAAAQVEHEREAWAEKHAHRSRPDH